jgi:hypothetical protein
MSRRRHAREQRAQWLVIPGAVAEADKAAAHMRRPGHADAGQHAVAGNDGAALPIGDG